MSFNVKKAGSGTRKQFHYVQAEKKLFSGAGRQK